MKVVSERDFRPRCVSLPRRTDRASFQAASGVEKMQELILDLLSRVCGAARGGPQRFGRLLGRLTELRTLHHNYLLLRSQRAHRWRNYCWNSVWNISSRLICLQNARTSFFFFFNETEGKYIQRVFTLYVTRLALRKLLLLQCVSICSKYFCRSFYICPKNLSIS